MSFKRLSFTIDWWVNI